MLGGISARRRGLILVFIATICMVELGFRVLRQTHRSSRHMDDAVRTRLFRRHVHARSGDRRMAARRSGSLFRAWPFGATADRDFGDRDQRLRRRPQGDHRRRRHGHLRHAAICRGGPSPSWIGGDNGMTRRTLIAAGVAFAGVLVMVASAVGTGRLTGQIICSVGMAVGFRPDDGFAAPPSRHVDDLDQCDRRSFGGQRQLPPLASPRPDAIRSPDDPRYIRP